MGAGFAGLTCARRLRRAGADVLLLDRNNYHVFTPLLYQVASSLLEPGQVAHPVRALLRPLRHCTFRQASVVGADLERRVVVTDRGEVAYDYLVLAAGSESNYFGKRSLEERSLGLKQLPEAMAIRNWVLQSFERARWTADADERRALQTFAVVGGGPTGVEYAGALAELIRLVLVKDYPELDLSEVRVVLMEGSRSLLGAFHPRLQAAAARSLEAKGVEVWFEALVREVGPQGVLLEDGRSLKARTVVWTAGVRAASLGAAIGLRLTRSGRVAVEPTLQVPGRPEVLACGDLAGAVEDGRELPMLIPVAMQEAEHAARVVRALIEGAIPAPFRYRDPGIMATIGRNSAVAQLGFVRLSGFLGWLMWLGVHLVNVVSFRSRLFVLLNWAWDYFFYDRPIRLILRSVEPRAPEGPVRPEETEETER